MSKKKVEKDGEFDTCSLESEADGSNDAHAVDRDVFDARGK
jgi:hypothetical protein